MNETQDFQPEPLPPPSKNSGATVLWIIGGAGCGCLSLIMLLMVSAIALPSFLNQADKARESEAKNNVGAMNRGQQAHFLGENQFAPSLEALGLGIVPESENYRYQIEVQPDNQSVKMTAQGKKASIKSYTGAVFIIQQGGERTTVTGICESNRPGVAPPEMPLLDTTSPTPTVDCAEGSSAL